MIGEKVNFSILIFLIFPLVDDRLTHSIDLFRAFVLAELEVYILENLVPACGLSQLSCFLNQLLLVFDIELLSLFELLFLLLQKRLYLGASSLLTSEFLFVFFVLGFKKYLQPFTSVLTGCVPPTP